MTGFAQGFRQTSRETRREIKFLEKVEQCGKWLQQACTTMFFLIVQNVTSERPIALLPTVGVAACARGEKMARKGIVLNGNATEVQSVLPPRRRNVSKSSNSGACLG